jgi:hypothetical protein
MPTYYTYKDEVPLLPGQTLGFTAGKGYYAAGTPTPTQATRETTGYQETYVSPAAAPAPTPTYTSPTASRTAAQTYDYPEADVSAAAAPSPAPAPAQPAQTPAQLAQTQPVPATPSQAPTTAAASTAAAASTQPTPATGAQAASKTAALAASVDKPVATPARAQPIRASLINQRVEQTIAYPSDSASSDADAVNYYTYRDEVPLEPGQTIRFKPGQGYYAVGPSKRPIPGAALSTTQPIPAHSRPSQAGATAMTRVQPSAAGTPIPRADQSATVRDRTEVLLTTSRADTASELSRVGNLHTLQPTVAGTPVPGIVLQAGPPGDRELAAATAKTPPKTPPVSQGYDGSSNWPLRTRELYAFQYLLENTKLSAVQVAGVLGNLMQESGMNPRTPGGLIAQWGGGRLAKLMTFAGQHGGILPDGTVQFSTQVAFIAHELTGSESAAYAKIQQATSVSAAAYAVMTYYERPYVPLENLPRRESFANAIYDLHLSGAF